MIKPLSLSTEKLLKIYKIVKVKPQPVYKPVRKHYNAHSFGWLSMKNEQSILVGNTSKRVLHASPSLHTTLVGYIVEKMEVITGNIIERTKKTTDL